jgi:alpha-glucosidase
MAQEQLPWWKSAVIYQIYPRSFFDSNGDGEGDLAGISSKIDYLHSLNIDALWLSPFYESPNRDGGYDVSDPREIDARFGTFDDFQRLIEACHERDIRVIIDIVPNHFSSDHRWFQDALQSPSGSAERDRFHFADSGANPPNNWISLFGGSAWSKVEDGEYYLHLFDETQPDLNWRNSDVIQDFDQTLRFWLDRGVDGFRIDVAHGLIKDDLENNHPNPQALSDALRLDVELEPKVRSEMLTTVPFFNRPGVHDVYRSWRKIFDSYDREIVSVAEIWVHPPVEAAHYVRPDELSQVFNFDLLTTGFESRALFESISQAFAILEPVGALPTWALSNHDSPRVASRLGVRQSQSLFIALLALPGSLYLYNGQELSLPDVMLEDSYRQDPVFFRTGGKQKGRDGARVPLPWSSTQSHCGFTSGTPWLPIPPEWSSASVETQNSDESSSLNLFRRAIAARREVFTHESEITWANDLEKGLLAFNRGKYLVLLNTSDADINYSCDGDIVLKSDSEVELNQSILTLPPASACWVKVSERALD